MTKNQMKLVSTPEILSDILEEVQAIRNELTPNEYVETRLLFIDLILRNIVVQTGVHNTDILKGFLNSLHPDLINIDDRSKGNPHAERQLTLIRGLAVEFAERIREDISKAKYSDAKS